jgi:hypothetical protein
MNGVATVYRLTTILAAAAAFICADGPASARDTTQGPRIGLSLAIVSNGLVTYKIPNGPGGLELSSNAPGTITVSSGSNSVTVRGPALTLSGGVVLAPFATPGVHVAPNSDGSYTAVLDTPLGEWTDTDTPEKKETASRLSKDLAQQLADADFGDRTVTAGRCVAPLSNNSASP